MCRKLDLLKSLRMLPLANLSLEIGLLIITTLCCFLLHRRQRQDHLMLLGSTRVTSTQLTRTLRKTVEVNT